MNRKAEASAVWGKTDILNRLASLHDRFAVNEDAPSGSVARAALMDYAKLNGLVVDKQAASIDMSVNVKRAVEMTDDELAAIATRGGG